MEETTKITIDKRAAIRGAAKASKAVRSIPRIVTLLADIVNADFSKVPQNLRGSLYLALGRLDDLAVDLELARRILTDAERPSNRRAE